MIQHSSSMTTCRPRPQMSYLYGVAVDGLSSARHVHRLGDLQDVVGYIARRPAAVTNLPPLLPVVQNLTAGAIRKRFSDTVM